MKQKRAATGPRFQPFRVVRPGESFEELLQNIYEAVEGVYRSMSAIWLSGQATNSLKLRYEIHFGKGTREGSESEMIGSCFEFRVATIFLASQTAT